MKSWKLFTVAMVPCLLASILTGCTAALPATAKSATPIASQNNLTAQTGTSSLMQQLWDENYPFYQKILAHPYNQQLLSGQLDEEIFRQYIIQDYHFCQYYKKAHAILLAKAPDETASKFMANIIGQIDDEIAVLHEVYIKKYNITDQELTSPTAYPSTELYCDFLIRTATLEPFEVGLMATMPCHWVYYQVGVDMKKAEKVQGNKYQAWIDEYGSETWENSGTKVVVDFAEKYMQAASAETRLKMKNAFVTALKLEYMFWDGVYNKVKWVE
jgi:thiaminase (transcriptional activator TenA)